MGCHSMIMSRYIKQWSYACLTGLGGRCENKVYHLKIPKHYNNLGIVQLEMVNILVAVRLFGCMWQHKRVLIKCDNMAVVQVLKTGKTCVWLIPGHLLHTLKYKFYSIKWFNMLPVLSLVGVT